MINKEKIKKILVGTIKDFIELTLGVSLALTFLFGLGYLIYHLSLVVSLETMIILIILFAILFVSLLCNITKNL